MSIDGNGDDIEDRLEELVSEMKEMNRLLRAAMEQPREEQQEDVARGDLWDVGVTSPKVSTEGQYKQFRVDAASSEDIVAPYFSHDAFDSFEDRINARFRIFEEGYDSLQSLSASLGDDAFDAVIRKFAKTFLTEDIPAAGPLNTDLLEMSEPGAGFFGVREVGGDISVTERLTPLDFVVAWGDFYHPKSIPWDALRKEAPTEVGEVKGQVAVGEVNQQLAEMVFQRRGLKLPAKYVNLLPADKQTEWRRENE